MVENYEPEWLNIMEGNMEGEDKYANLSIEEITLKIKTYISLCRTNRINSSNAFDIDVVGYFSSWLKKRKKAPLNNDLEMFQEIADNLEACDKVYGYRVENATCSTSKLIEDFKIMCQTEISSNVDENPKHQEFKRTKCMLTTADKLNSKLAEMGYFSCSFLADVKDFDLNTIFLTQRPSVYVNSLYKKFTLKDDMNQKQENYKVDPDKSIDPIKCGKMTMIQNKLTKGKICSTFHGFVSDVDLKLNNNEYDELDGIENRFDVDDQNQFYDYLCVQNDDDIKPDIEPNFEPDMEPNTELDIKPDIELDIKPDIEPDINISKFDEQSALSFTPNIPEQNMSNIADLVKCIDAVDRPYSFFNPKLFANFKGPKAWTTQIMIKSLKSCNKDEKKELMAIPGITDDMNSALENQTGRRRKKIIETKINWFTEEKLKLLWPESGSRVSLKSKMYKWNAIDLSVNIENTMKSPEVKFQSQFLKTHKILQDYHKHESQENGPDTSLGPENKDGFEESVEKQLNTTNDFDDNLADNGELEWDNHNEESCNLKSEQSFLNNIGIQNEFETESKMDMFKLKKNISEIIDKECIEIDPVNNWSSQLSFQTLLLKLMDKETDISIHIVFVALLHLTNERGFKLNHEPSDILNSIFISKPITRQL